VRWKTLILFVLYDKRRCASLTPDSILGLWACAVLHWAAHKGLHDDWENPNHRKRAARRAGLRDETYAYWYLRGQGYIFVARKG
jgi:hypothetical protein